MEGSKKRMIRADDPCEGCDGTDCPLLEEAGIICMDIKGLKEI